MARRRENKDRVRTFEDWYAEHKDELAKKKKAKYESDTEYRDSIKERTNREYRKKVGILDNGLRLVKSKGVSFVGYKLADAAGILGVNIHTLRWYISSGYVPPFIVDGSSLRIITVDQMPLFEKFLSKVTKESVAVVSEEMAPYILKHWRDRHGSKKIINKEA